MFQPVVYKPGEQAIVASDRSYDRKYMFLAEETKPDYRYGKPNQTRLQVKETKPNQTTVMGNQIKPDYR